MSRETTATRHRRKTIDKNIEVVVSNGTYGMFVFESKNQELSLDLNGHGDDDFVSYGELRKLKKFLGNMQLLITEVDSDEVSIMDVARGLRIDDVYTEYMDLVEGIDSEEAEGVDSLDIDAMEDFVVDSDTDEFKKALDSKFRHTVVDTAVEMYKERRLSDHAKIDLIKKTRPGNSDDRSDFFSDIDASLDD